MNNKVKEQKYYSQDNKDSVLANSPTLVESFMPTSKKLWSTRANRPIPQCLLVNEN